MEQLHQQVLAKDQEISDLKKLLMSSGLVSKEESHGLIPHKGRPPTKANPKKTRREAQAACVLRLSKTIQGPDLGTNIATLVSAAIQEDPSVRELLIQTGCLPTSTIETPDRRFKSKVRIETTTRLMSTKNASLYQASTGATAHSIDELRHLGGSKLIETPEQLQAWMVRQPELPPFKFVREGSSVVYVPIDELLAKLMSNPRITDKIRTIAPYDRSSKIFVYHMVITTCLVLTMLFIRSDCPGHIAIHKCDCGSMSVLFD